MTNTYLTFDWPMSIGVGKQSKRSLTPLSTKALVKSSKSDFGGLENELEIQSKENILLVK